MSLEDLERRIRRCRKCSLHKTRHHAVPGEGKRDAKIMLIGEAPGREEDEKGRPFVGMAGRILDRILKEIHLERKDIYITSILKCRPPENRDPKKGEIATCRPYLISQIKEVNPKVLVTLGRYGLMGLTGKNHRISEIEGKKLQWDGRTIIPTFHPAAIRFNKKLLSKIKKDLRRAIRLSKG